MKAKRILSLAVCIVVAASIFTGCTGKSNANDTSATTTNQTTGTEPVATQPVEEKVTLTYWQHSSQARDNMMKTIAYEFMQANSNINVKMEFIPYDDYSTKLISSLATNAAPDVFQVQSGTIAKLVKADTIQPLNETVMSIDSIKNDFIPATVDALQVGGKYYGMPTDTQTILLYWNKGLVSAAGLDAEKGPQTWDDMLSWAKKLTKFEKDKMVQSGWGEKGYSPEVQAIIYQYGGKIVDESGNYAFADDAKSIEATKFFVDAYKIDKVYDTKFIANWAGFRVGKVAMMLGHPAMLGNLKQTAPTVDLGVGLIPAKDGNPTTVVTSWAYVISKKADSEAATKLVQFLSSTEVEKRWTQQTGELPARKALLTDADLVADPKLAIILSSLNDSKVGYIQDAALYDIFKKGYEELILTDVSIEEGLKKIQASMNEEVAKALK